MSPVKLSVLCEGLYVSQNHDNNPSGKGGRLSDYHTFYIYMIYPVLTKLCYKWQVGPNFLQFVDHLMMNFHLMIIFYFMHISDSDSQWLLDKYNRSFAISLQWRHNGYHGVSNHQPYGCLLNRLFRRRSKKIVKLRITGLCAGTHRWLVDSSHKWPVTWKIFPFDDVIMVSDSICETHTHRFIE